jgi:hypothetical protein
LKPELYSQKNIAIKLNFKNPATISSQSEFDTLEVIAKESVIVISGASQIILAKNLKDFSSIPPQLT